MADAAPTAEDMAAAAAALGAVWRRRGAPVTLDEEEEEDDESVEEPSLSNWRRPLIPMYAEQTKSARP